MAIRKMNIRAVTVVMTQTAIPTGSTANSILGSNAITDFVGGAATKVSAVLRINMKATTTVGLLPTIKIAKILGMALAA